MNKKNTLTIDNIKYKKENNKYYQYDKSKKTWKKISSKAKIDKINDKLEIKKLKLEVKSLKNNNKKNNNKNYNSNSNSKKNIKQTINNNVKSFYSSSQMININGFKVKIIDKNGNKKYYLFDNNINDWKEISHCNFIKLKNNLQEKSFIVRF